MKSSQTVQIHLQWRVSKTVQIHLQWRVPKQSKFTFSEEFPKQSKVTSQWRVPKQSHRFTSSDEFQNKVTGLPPVKSSKTKSQVYLQWRVPKQSHRFTFSEEFQNKVTGLPPMKSSKTKSMSTRWVGIFEMLSLLQFCSDFYELLEWCRRHLGLSESKIWWRFVEPFGWYASRKLAEKNVCIS